MADMFLSGDTIRIQATFMNFDEQVTDPEMVKFIVYDGKYHKLQEIVIDDANKISEGVYFFDYTIPENSAGNKFYYEFFGLINGKPILNRGHIISIFS